MGSLFAMMYYMSFLLWYPGPPAHHRVDPHSHPDGQTIAAIQASDADPNSNYGRALPAPPSVPPNNP